MPVKHDGNGYPDKDIDEHQEEYDGECRSWKLSQIGDAIVVCASLLLNSPDKWLSGFHIGVHGEMHQCRTAFRRARDATARSSTWRCDMSNS